MSRQARNWFLVRVSLVSETTPCAPVFVDLDLLRFLGAVLVVMAVPGPSVLYAITQRVQHGRVAGAVAVLGLETGLLAHVLAACLGVSAAIAATPLLLTSLRFGGAGYLAFLGLQQLGIGLPWNLRAQPHSRMIAVPATVPASTQGSAQGSAPEPGPSLWRIYRAGVLVDLLNPKSLVFFLALLPQFIPGGVMSVPLAALMISCVVGLGLVFDGGYAALAGRLPRTALAPARRFGPPLAGWCFLALAASVVVG